jgi:hypothetical protein
LYEAIGAPDDDRCAITPREPVDTHTLPSEATSMSPAPATLAKRVSEEKARGFGHRVSSFVIGTVLVVGAGVAEGDCEGVVAGVGETLVAGVMAGAVPPHAKSTVTASSEAPARTSLQVTLILPRAGGHRKLLRSAAAF